MRTLFAKLWFDLWQDKSRTLQVVLVIALGAIGIGLVIGGRNLIAGTIADQWRAASPPHIKVSVNPPLSDEALKDLERIEGVAEIEGLLSSSVEWRIVGQDEWQRGLLNARDDYQVQKMELETLVSGDWPGRGTLSVVKTADTLYGVEEGDTLQVRFDDKIREYPVTGVMKPVGPFPVVFVGALPLYVTRDTFQQITGRDTYNLVQTRDVQFDFASAERTDLAMQDYFEANDIDSVGVFFPFQDRIISPDIPPAAELLNAIFLLLGLIGVIIVILGIFLVYNSVSAIMSQQVSQIGVMKAIGGSSWQVIRTYLLLVMSYGALAAVISIPVGGLSARGLENLFIQLLNLEPTPFTFDGLAVLVQVLICLVVPLLAAALPLRSGMRITVREAISTYGLAGSIGLVEKLVAGVRRLPYTVLLIVGNTFRNRRRVLLIEITLVLAGVIFMMVLGVNDATSYTFGDRLSRIHNYQVTLSFEDVQRESRITNVVSAVPDVTAAEMWLVSSGKVRPITQADSSVEDARITIFGKPVDTQMYLPEMREGRWLTADDTQAAVIHQRLASVTGWSVGDWVTFSDANGRESDWQIVGVLFDPASSNALYVPLPQLQREIGAVNQANTLWVQTVSTDAASQLAAAEALSAALTGRGIDLAARTTFGETTLAAIVDDTGGGFSLIITLLAIMAVIIALVGGVGLSGVLALNVLERRREIGVMRSIGASTWQVIRLYIGEGMLLGIVSWLIALPLSIPAAWFLATQGLSFALQTQLVYRFTITGAVLWLIIILLLALFASILPARGAAKVSVRESLAYQ